MRTKKIITLALIFLTINIAVFTFTQDNSKKRIDLVLKEDLNRLQIHFDILNTSQKNIANAISKSIIRNTDVVEVLSESYTASKEQNQLNREKLYKQLEEQYETAKQQGILQIQFVNRNNISFLRVHKPSKFGDDLTDVREDYKIVNETKKSIRGFTQGRVAHGFRNSFPIFDKNNNHIGAMEISFSSEQYQWYLNNINHIHSHFLVDKDIFDTKTWQRKDLVIKYNPSAEHKNLMLNLNKDQSKEVCLDDNKIKLTPHRTMIDKKIVQGEKFNFYLDHKGDIEIISFLPIKNLSHKTVAWIVSHTKSDIVKSSLNSTFTVRVVAFLVSILIIYLLIRQIKSNNKIHRGLKELNENQLFMDSILNNSAHAIIATDIDGNITLFNKKAEEMLGYKSSEVISIHTPALFHKESEVIQRAKEYSEELDIELKPGFEVFTAKTEVGVENSDEWTYINKNDMEFPISLNITKQINTDNTLIGYIGIVEDITKRKELENKIKESEFRWNFAVEGNGDGLWDWNIKTKEVYFSPMWKSMLGFKEDEIENSLAEWEKRVNPEHLKGVFDAIKEHLDGKTEVYESEHQVLCKDGSYKWILDRGVIVQRDNNNEPIRMIGTHSDISNRKVLEEAMEFQKEELETIFNTNKDGIAIIDLETNFLFFNDSYLKMSGFTKEELLEKSCAGLSAPEDLPRAQKALAEVLEIGFIENFEKTCIVKDEKRVQVNMSIALMPDNQRLLLSVKDITESKKKEKQIKEYLNLIDKNIITYSTDLDGKITSVSEAFCKISGYSKSEIIGKNHRIVKHPDMPNTIYKDIWETITNNKTWQGEIKNKAKDSSYYWVHSSISPVFDDCGQKVGYTAIRQDITDKKTLELISITDGLTNIFNRRHFNEVFPQMIEISKRGSELLCFLIMDIDHFKQYNDTYGHQMGDDVLIKVSKCIKDSLKRDDDYCFRLGGEEFGMLYKASTKEDAISFANIVRENLENLHIEHTGNSASSYVTISMGLVCKKASDIEGDDIAYKQADDLLYKAKESGRNKVCINKG